MTERDIGGETLAEHGTAEGGPVRDGGTEGSGAALREAVELAVRTLESEDGYYTAPWLASTGEGKEYASVLERVMVILQMGLRGEPPPDNLKG